MKKILSLFAACALCGSMLAALPVSAEETTRKTGDVNGDGFVDSDDAVFISNYYAKSILNLEEDYVSKLPAKFDLSLEIADVNKDGVIDNNDTLRVLRFYAYSILDLTPDTIEEWRASFKK